MRKTVWFATLWVIFFGLAPPARADAKFGELTPQQVNQQRKKPNFFVYDNNQQGRWKKSHVPGARWVDPFAMTEKDLPKDKSATLVFYCANEH